jgi:hypothetical protein
MKVPASPSPETESQARLKVFLCHSSGDKEFVREQHARLKADGFIPWLDEENILPGQDWDSTIQIAVRESHVVVVFLSASAITKEGYLQREIRLVLDVADEKPEGTIFVIPARVEPCEVPQRLRAWQWVNLFDARGYDRLAAALRSREAQVHQRVSSAETITGITSGKTSPPSPPPVHSATPASAALRRQRKAWSRGDKFGLAAVAIALVGLPGVYLAVPDVAEYVRDKILTQRTEHKVATLQPTAVAQQEHPPTLVGTNSDQAQQPTATAGIFIQTTVFPVRVYLDDSPVATLTAAAPSTTLDTSFGAHKVSVRSTSFRHDETVTLLPGGSPKVLFIDKDQNLKNDRLDR